MNKYIKQLKEGIIDQNPTLVQFLGMCPTLATTTSVSNAIGMGLAATAVLICSNVFISLLRKFIPKEIRIASYIVIISAFVTAVELLMKAFFTPIYDALGLYIPLIVVNCIILARAEAYASKSPVLPSAVDGLSMGLGFTAALLLLASVREILGAGTWLGIRITPTAFEPALIFILPAGAFLTLGFLAAAVNRSRAFAAEYAASHPKPSPIEAIPDEFVTEANDTEAPSSDEPAKSTEESEQDTSVDNPTDAADDTPSEDADEAADDTERSAPEMVSGADAAEHTESEDDL
ncbi:MAG: electron transport complex subunit RsxE [Clostridia bacterium]|nr:electron transport complex subunit RsxE [Clostridia bacterium]